MNGAALRLALQLWTRRPGALLLANAAAFLGLALPLALLPLLPGEALRRLALLAWGLWAWMIFAALCAAVASLESGPLAWGRLRAWLRVQGGERLLCGAAGLGLGAAALAACRFYAALGGPWGRALWVLPASGLLWLGLALLLSQGLASAGAQAWRDLWKASALLPLAYAPAALGAGCLLALGLGLPGLWLGPAHWTGRLLLAPLLLSPLGTLAGLAAFLSFLSRGLLDRARGHGAPAAPSWRELLRPGDDARF